MRTVGQRGSAALWTLVLLPLALTFSVFSIDLNGWMALSDRLQREADRMAMQAANALPDEERARNIFATSSAALSAKIPALTAAISFSNKSSVEVSLSATYSAVFDNFVQVFARAAPLTFQARRLSRAAIVPADVVLIIPDGATLAPRRDAPWGDPVTWPPSSFFERYPGARIVQDANAPIGNGQHDYLLRRQLTQSCFNPVLSRVKEAAIGFSNAFLEQRTNRLALFFTPGNPADSGATALRHLRREAAANGHVFLKGWIGGFISPAGPAAHWAPYSEPESGVSDAACVLFSSPDTTISRRYSLPARELSGDCVSPFKPIPEGFIFDPYRVNEQLNSCYFDVLLSLDEATYWHAARVKTEQNPALPDIQAALRKAYNEFPLPNRVTYFGEEQAIRGALAALPRRGIVLITDYLPPIDSDLDLILDQIASLGRTGQPVHLAVIALEHDGLTTGERDLLRLTANAWQSWQPPDELDVRVLSAADPSELSRDIFPRLLAGGRQIALQR